MQQHKSRRHHTKVAPVQLVSWCFEPSQPQRITAGLRQYSNMSLRYQLKVELHTSLDTRRLYLYARLSFKQRTLRKQFFFFLKSHKQNAFQTPCWHCKLNLMIKVNECLIQHGLCTKLDKNDCSSNQKESQRYTYIAANWVNKIPCTRIQHVACATPSFQK